MTSAQRKVMDNASRFHESRVWITNPNGSIRICLFNKTKKEFEFLTVLANGASVGKEFYKSKVDDTLMSIWKQLPSTEK